MAKHWRAKKDAPLSCELRGNQLIITIGISTLTFVESEGLVPENEKGSVPRVTNEKVFAREVMRAMRHEDESGQSILNKMFDDAIVYAIGDGCEGIEYPSDTVKAV